ncbi:MAG: FMN-dependent NADH-azoreductase [Hyphomonadaceae bacterium]|nr:MAG: FMN-dependent NADH-azoreductase [Hyphomonadaceae bacterium]
MTKLLYIQSSPRKGLSSSNMIAQAYIDALLDLWQEELPQFDGDKNAAKFNVMLGQDHNEVQQSAWDQITKIANRFAGADHYVFAIPMWNGSVPYKLKHYIDVIHQPAILFGLDPAIGYFGLLQNKKATLVFTSGAYSPAAPSPAFGIDHQSPYVKAWLNQAGVIDIEELRFQPSLLTPSPEEDLQKIIAEAKALAQK